MNLNIKKSKIHYNMEKCKNQQNQNKLVFEIIWLEKFEWWWKLWNAWTA